MVRARLRVGASTAFLLGMLLVEAWSPPGRATIAEMCPEAEFRAALSMVANATSKPALARAGGAEAVVGRYLDKWGGRNCRSQPGGVDWPISQHARGGLLLGAGTGTTGTRYLACLFSSFGLRVFHTKGENDRVSERLRCTQCFTNGSTFMELEGMSRTAAWDQYDFVTDTPVPDELAFLYATHPGKLLAGVILTVRDPVEWKRSRIEHHPHSENSTRALDAHRWNVGGLGCSAAELAILGDSDLLVSQDKFVYDSWAACRAMQDGRSRDDLLILNLFVETAEQVEARLLKFLSGRPLVTRSGTRSRWRSTRARWAAA